MYCPRIIQYSTILYNIYGNFSAGIFDIKFYVLYIIQYNSILYQGILIQYNYTL